MWDAENAAAHDAVHEVIHYVIDKRDACGTAGDLKQCALGFNCARSTALFVIHFCYITCTATLLCD